MTGWTSPDEVAGEDGDLEVISNSATRCLPWKTTEQAFVCPTKQLCFRFLKIRETGIDKVSVVTLTLTPTLSVR
jgi:hypothetical protein